MAIVFGHINRFGVSINGGATPTPSPDPADAHRLARRFLESHRLAIRPSSNDSKSSHPTLETTPAQNQIILPLTSHSPNSPTKTDSAPRYRVT